MLAAGLAALASLSFALGAPEHVDTAWLAQGFFLAVALAELALAVALIAWTWPGELPFRIGPLVVIGAYLVAASVLVYLLVLAGGGTHGGHDPAAGPRPVDLLTKGAEVGLFAVLVWLRTLIPD